MGRSDLGVWYCSGGLECTGASVGGGLFLAGKGVRVLCRKGGMCQLGFGQTHMGRSGKEFWYYSCNVGCTGMAGEEVVVLAGKIVGGTNESVSVVPSVIAASTKVLVSALPNVDNLSDSVAGGHADHESKEVSLEEWKESKSQWNHLYRCDGVGIYDWNFQADEEPTNYALMAFTSSSSSSSDNENFYAPKPDLVFHDASTASKTVPNVFHVKPHTTKPNKGMSQSNRPSAPTIKDWVSDSEDESKGKPMPTQKEPSFVQTTKHVKTPMTSVKPVEHTTQAENLRKDIPKSRGHKHSWTKKGCFVCKSLTYLIKDCDYYDKKMVQKPVWNHAMRVNRHNSARMTHPYSNNHVVPTAVLTRSKPVPLNAARPVTTVVPQTHVKHQRPIKRVVNKPHLPIIRPINHRPSPKNNNFHQKVTTVKAKQGNPQQALKDKGVIDGGCSRHMTENISYLSDFEKINGGYVAFGGNPKGGKITDTECVVLSFDIKLPDDNHVLLRVPRENNMYNVDLKNIVPSEDLTGLFAKATLDESNICHRRLGHINF
nr:hypothetical protein [Tanacetum cinerariifolium]